MTKNGTQKKNSNFLRLDFLIITVILCLGLGLRIYKITNPLADWHSWRQSDTAAVARNLTVKFDLLRPRYDDLSNIQSGKDNPEGLRMVEFPIYNAIFATLYRYLPILPLEVYGRLTSVFFSLVLIAILYYLTLREHDRIAATAAALLFATFPFFVFYSRVILPEMTALSLIFSGIFFMYLFTSNPQKKPLFTYFFYTMSIFSTAMALLVKPTVIFYFVPFIYLFYKKNGFFMFKSVLFYLFFILSVAPFALWRFWITQFPEGIPAADWLLFAVNTPQGLQHIFLRPAFFRWIFSERILNLILGGYMAVYLIVGIIVKPKKSFFFHACGLASLLYLFTFEGGNVQHDYYQTLILPSLALFTGVGISYLVSNKSTLNLFISIPLAISIFALSFFFSYYRVKDYYNYNADTVTIAKIVKSITTPEDLVVTDSDGDTTLLYLSERKGYPAVTEDLHKLKDKGLDYFVTGKHDVAEKVKKEFETAFYSDKVYIFKL